MTLTNDPDPDTDHDQMECFQIRGRPQCVDGGQNPDSASTEALAASNTGFQVVGPPRGVLSKQVSKFFMLL